MALKAVEQLQRLKKTATGKKKFPFQAFFGNITYIWKRLYEINLHILQYGTVESDPDYPVKNVSLCLAQRERPYPYVGTHFQQLS